MIHVSKVKATEIHFGILVVNPYTEIIKEAPISKLASPLFKEMIPRFQYLASIIKELSQLPGLEAIISFKKIQYLHTDEGML
jgi:hypothetical protein